MQESFCYFVGILLAGLALLLIAFPDRMIPEPKEGRKKKFTARHWGNYDGMQKDAASSEEEEGVEVGIPAKKIRHVVGSSTYAGGRGVSMRS